MLKYYGSSFTVNPSGSVRNKKNQTSAIERASVFIADWMGPPALEILGAFPTLSARLLELQRERKRDIGALAGLI